jgi:CDGSH-type Zn-finger protein
VHLGEDRGALGRGEGCFDCEHDRRMGANARRRIFVDERTKVIALDDGPYLVKGPVVLLGAEGNEFFTQRATLALCRCGRSTNKPFCDGTHSKAGFPVAERAVRAEQGVRL